MKKHFQLFSTKLRNWRALEHSRNRIRKRGLGEKMIFRKCRTNLLQTSPFQIQWTWANNPTSFQSSGVRLELSKYMTLQEMSNKVTWTMISVLSQAQSPRGKDTICSTAPKARKRNNNRVSKLHEEERSLRNFSSHRMNNSLSHRKVRWTKWAQIKIVQEQWMREAQWTHQIVQTKAHLSK